EPPANCGGPGSRGYAGGASSGRRGTGRPLRVCAVRPGGAGHARSRPGCRAAASLFPVGGVRLMRAILGLLLGLFGPLISSVAAQEPLQLDPSALHPSGPPAAFRQGTQGFRQLLHRMELDEPLASAKELFKKPETTLLIVLGDTSILKERSLDEFLSR